MATVKDTIPHVVRTANDPRQTGLYDATVSHVEQVNKNIRLLRLSVSRDGPPFRHLPGQYVDFYAPNTSTVGGFTITSPPQTALPNPSIQHSPYIELAIQRSPQNPPAAFCWQPPSALLHSPVQLRIGGIFAYPPLSFTRQECEQIQRVVFVAGGVGINPIMSMISAMDGLGTGRIGGMVKDVRVLYASRRGWAEDGQGRKKRAEILFESRLRGVAERWSGHREVDFRMRLFESGDVGKQEPGEKCSEVVKTEYGRISYEDLLEAFGPEEERMNTVVYVCGVPTMTDEFVDFSRKQKGLDEKRVLCEKWW